MRLAIATLLGLTVTRLPAQDRQLQAGDVAARKTAAAVLAFGIDSFRSSGEGDGAQRLQAAVGTAQQRLPAGSTARAALDGRAPLVSRWLVEPDVRRIFAYRAQQIAQRFGGDAADAHVAIEPASLS